jgi:hypothetical protein
VQIKLLSAAYYDKSKSLHVIKYGGAGVAMNIFTNTGYTALKVGRTVRNIDLETKSIHFDETSLITSQINHIYLDELATKGYFIADDSQYYRLTAKGIRYARICYRILPRTLYIAS